MFFELRLLNVIIFVGVIIWQEIAFKKKYKEKPFTLREILSYTDSKKTPDPRWRALSLVLMVLFFFSIWEFVVYYMFARAYSLWSFYLGAIMLLSLFFIRYQKLKKNTYYIKLNQKELLFWFVAICLQLESLITLSLIFWLFIRSRFLKSPTTIHSNF